jgi:hypothetical protein
MPRLEVSRAFSGTVTGPGQILDHQRHRVIGA